MNNYQPYYQQIQQLQNQIPQIQQQMQIPQQIMPQNGGMFYFVNSQKEAEDWVVGAGQTVFFFDRNNSIFYIKSVAQNGLSQPLEVYEYSQKMAETKSKTAAPEIDMSQYVTHDELNELLSKLETKPTRERKAKVTADE